MMPHQILANKYNSLIEPKTLLERLTLIAAICQRPLFTTSLGREDQALLWHICQIERPIRIVTLQTGRLFPETLSLLAITRDQYAINIEEVKPETNQVSAYIRDFGKNGFYDSLEARKACCNIRKIAPLTKILGSADGWITGLTREQSDGRSSIPFAQWDVQNQIMKFNPIADVISSTIDADIIAHEIPTNSLHNKGYPSIGCEPCTRAIKKDEHPRAGRWWWETDESQECGLHRPADEKVKQDLNNIPTPIRKSANVGC